MIIGFCCPYHKVMLLGHSEDLYINCYLLSQIPKTVCLLFELEPPLMCSCCELDPMSTFFLGLSLSIMHKIVHSRLYSCKLLFLKCFYKLLGSNSTEYLDVLPCFIVKSLDNSLVNFQFYWEKGHSTVTHKKAIVSKQVLYKPLNFELPISFVVRKAIWNSTILYMLISERIMHGTKMNYIKLFIHVVHSSITTLPSSHH
jgi:hypothetical protein